MQILEVSKNYLCKYYDNDLDLCIRCKDGVIWNKYKIQKAFKLGKGKISDFKNYMNNNKKYCYYYDLENNKIL